MIGAAWQRRGWWALLLLLTQAAMALDPQRSLDHYGHQVWRTDSGLPQNTVHSMLQTRDGYLWLGTDGGLVRFDGIDFVTFDTENTPQFLSDIVYDLFQDGSGTLWISTGAGLVSYAGGAFAAYSRAQGLPAETVWFSYEDRRHRLWAITSGGPAFFNGKSFAPVAGAEPAGPLTRDGLAEDPQGTLWLGGSSGVFALDIRPSTPRLARRLLSGIEVETVRLDRERNLNPLDRHRPRAGTLCRRPDRSRPYPQYPGQSRGHRFRADAAGGMWVGTAAGVVHLAADGAWLSLRSNGPEVGRVDHLFRDRQGVLWIATERGIFRLEANQLQSFAPVSALAGNRVLAMYEDREGDLWLGTDGNGLHLLRDQKFTTYTTSDGLSGNLVRCVFQSSNGELWIGTDGAGLNRRTSTGFAHITTADGLSSNVILSLAGGAGGDLWVGTPDGLNLLHPNLGQKGSAQKIERFTSADGLPDDFIRSLYTDRDGSLWIGTRHGLAHLAGGKFTSFSGMDGLGSDFIGAILRARNGNLDGDLWVGTSGGLSRLHQGAFSNYTGQQGLSDNVVTAIAQDRDANQETLWLGTNGGGLNRWRRAGIEPFPSSAQGLPATIYGILEDARGRLWLSSKTGIFRVSPARLEQPGAEAAVATYGTADGMNIRECSGSGHPAAWKMADGSLWFATLDGVSVIDPEHAPENRVPPPVVIEKVLVDDQVRSLNQDLTIKPGANRLEFQYAGLSFVAPQKVSTVTSCRALTGIGSTLAAGGQPSTPICPPVPTGSRSWQPTMTASGIPPAPRSHCASCPITTRPTGSTPRLPSPVCCWDTWSIAGACCRWKRSGARCWRSGDAWRGRSTTPWPRALWPCRCSWSWWPGCSPAPGTRRSSTWTRPARWSAPAWRRPAPPSGTCVPKLQQPRICPRACARAAPG